MAAQFLLWLLLVVMEYTLKFPIFVYNIQIMIFTQSAIKQLYCQIVAQQYTKLASVVWFLTCVQEVVGLRLTGVKAEVAWVEHPLALN